MKHAADKQTLDLLSGVRPQGRPPKPGAMSGAERQRLRRARLKAAGVETITLELPVEVVQALRKFVEFKDEDYSAAAARILKDRLMRKR